MPSLSEGSLRTRAIVGWYEMLAGVIGVLFMCYLAWSAPSSLPSGNLLVAALPFSLSAIAGQRLLKVQRYGGRMTLVVQCLQVPFWTLHSSTWKFVAGLFITFTARDESLKVDLGTAVTLVLGHGGVATSSAGLNLAPVLLLSLLFFALRRERRHARVRANNA